MNIVLRDFSWFQGDEGARAWDAFVEVSPSGSYQQTARWAEVKATVGWSATRVVVREGERILGGCQILHRPLAAFGTLAYVPRGPVLGEESQALLPGILDGLDGWARANSVRYLKLQPGPGGERTVEPALDARGFVASSVDVSPVTTVRIDLARSEPDLFAALSRTRRKNLRRADRKGVTAEAAPAAELGSFLALVAASADRQGFTPYPDSYYAQMLRSFQSELLMVRREGTGVAGQLLLGYGDTVYTKVFGWSGTDSDLYVSEVLDWASILWAKERGFRYLDLDGIAVPVARAILAGDPVPFEPTPSHYKLQYGGEVIEGPGTYDAVYPTLLRPGLRLAATRFDRVVPLAQRALKRARLAT